MATRARSSMTPAVVQRLLQSGVDEASVVAGLVGTGAWSESGALEIVRFMSGRRDKRPHERSITARSDARPR